MTVCIYMIERLYELLYVCIPVVSALGILRFFIGNVCGDRGTFGGLLANCNGQSLVRCGLQR